MKVREYISNSSWFLENCIEHHQKIAHFVLTTSSTVPGDVTKLVLRLKALTRMHSESVNPLKSNLNGLCLAKQGQTSLKAASCSKVCCMTLDWLHPIELMSTHGFKRSHPFDSVRISNACMYNQIVLHDAHILQNLCVSRVRYLMKRTWHEAVHTWLISS